MRLLPASDVSTFGILLILGFELSAGLLYGFVCVFLLRRRERTARTPDPKSGLCVLQLSARHAPDARKAA
jgi:hypothetical protein